MVTRKNIVDYYTKNGLLKKTQKTGIEVELFCIDNGTLRSIPYQTDDNSPSVQAIFEYLKAHEGYSSLDSTKTSGLKKGQSKITTEAAGQIEFSSAPHANLVDLFKEFQAYMDDLKKLSREFNVSWLDVAYFPIGSASDVPLVPNPRYRMLDEYFQKTGIMGRDAMRYTVSLHINFDYHSLSELEELVSRILLLKPILHFIAANSRLRAGRDTGLRSFRSIAYKYMDSPRTGTPGLEDIWNMGRWSLDSYIDKVLNAPAVFSGSSEPSNEPLGAYLSKIKMEDYIFHNCHMYTDIRIREYIEIRYADNPGIKNIPGFVVLLYKLLYDDSVWNSFKAKIPYHFKEVPIILEILNTVSEASYDYWECCLREPVESLVRGLQKTLEPSLSGHMEPILDRVVYYRQRDILPDLGSNTQIMSHFKNSSSF